MSASLYKHACWVTFPFCSVAISGKTENILVSCLWCQNSIADVMYTADLSDVTDSSLVAYWLRWLQSGLTSAAVEEDWFGTLCSANFAHSNGKSFKTVLAVGVMAHLVLYLVWQCRMEFSLLWMDYERCHMKIRLE